MLREINQRKTRTPFISRILKKKKVVFIELGEKWLPGAEGWGEWRIRRRW